MKDKKVFGIGFHKTGTTSLARALEMLGYKVTGPNGARNPNIAVEVNSLIYDLAEKYDAFQDNPWPLFYKELDKKYPGSKFILTLRPTDKWINSLTRHFGTKVTPMREWIYGAGFGCPVGNEQRYIGRYEQHNKEVIEYFKNRPNDLLIFNLTEGDGWMKLCPFLNEPLQDSPFPQENLAIERENHSKMKNNLFQRLIKGKVRD